jgi:phosphopantetheinyl transferase
MKTNDALALPRTPPETPLLGRLYEFKAAQELPEHDWRRDDNESSTHAAPEEQSLSRARDETHDDEPALPFVGRLLNHISGESVVIERRLALDEDLYLADHAFVHAPGVKPMSACMPVLPMAVGIEIMAEAAACLAPGHGLIGFEDIKANRWIALEDTDALMLRIEAQLQDGDAANGVHRVSVSIFVDGQTAPAMNATVLFSAHYLVTLPLSFTELSDAYQHPLTGEQMYAQREFFHGPRFQCLTGSVVVGSHGATGEILVRSQEDLFRSTQHPQLLTDPTLLDTAAQFIGVWAMAQERQAFPIGIAKVEFYRPTPPPGTRAPVRIEITHESSRTLHADVEIQDGAGAVWMRIKDWKMWMFQWDRRVVNFRRMPTRYLLSDTLNLRALQSGVCQRLSGENLIGFDIGILARFYLHVDEMAAFVRHASVPQRQRQWLLGRVVAKDAVRTWLAKRAGHEEMLHPAALIIENNAQGQPMVKLTGRTQQLPYVSIAHCKDQAIAIAHEGAVGVDIEQVVERDANFLQCMSSETERALLQPFTDDSRDEWITRLWCAKEALGKMMGTGVDGAPQAFEARTIDDDGVLDMHHHRSGREVHVRTMQDGGFVIAYVAESKP